MTMPFNPAQNGAPAPQQATFPLPPGQAAFQTPVPQQPTQIIREQGWQGYPASALPPVQQSQAPQPQYQQPTQQSQQQIFQPAIPPTQPAQWQPGMPVPTQHPQPQTQPGQQYQQSGQPQYQAPPGIDPNTVLQGPAFPPELQGQTLGQAIALYGGMRNLVLGLQQRQQQQTMAPAPGQTPQAPTPAPQQPGQNPAPFDWRNPIPQFEQLIGRALDERLAPIQQQSAMQAAAQARAAVAQEVGVQRFAQIEPMVLQYMQGATPQDLANPELWKVAVRTAIGDMALRGQNPGMPQQRVPQAGGAVPFQPGMQNPAPQLSTFFSESPNAGGQPVQGTTLTPQQMWFADQMNIPYATYASYSQGVPEQAPNGGRR